MVQTVGITKAITNLNEAHEKFNPIQTADTQFFIEWFEDLPEMAFSRDTCEIGHDVKKSKEARLFPS
jgi:hypothetical protein